MTERTYALSPDCGEKFYNQADYCIGTGRMGLALHKEYYDQLKLVQEHIGFPTSGATACSATTWPSTRSTKTPRGDGNGIQLHLPGPRAGQLPGAGPAPLPGAGLYA